MEALPPNPPCPPPPPNEAPNPPQLFSSGPPGPPGVNGINNGLVCLSGSGAPSNSLGADGDIYVDTTNLLFYGPKIAGVWGSAIGSIGGPAGGDLTGTFPNPTLIAVGTAGTYTKVTTDAKGRVTAGGALSPSDIPGGVELQANKGTANGYAGLDVNPYIEAANFPVLTGAVTTPGASLVTTLAVNGTSNSNLAQMAANTVKANLTGATANAQDVTLTALGTALSLAVTAIKTVKSQVFTASGTYTPSTGMLFCIAEVQGGGGGGGGAGGTSSQSAAGGGGGGGGYAKKVLSAATIGTSQTVTIGGTAAGGASGANNGSNGNNSTLGTLLTGAGGSAGNGGTSSATAVTGTSGGAGGAGTGGDFNLTGSSGGNGVAFGASTAGIGGIGGSAFLGSLTQGAIVTGDGVAGANYGGGGSGGAAGATNHAGGAGAQGIIIVTEFCSQ